MIVYRKDSKIAALLENWNVNNRMDGRVTTSHGAYHFDVTDDEEEEEIGKKCLIPDVAYTTAHVHQTLTEEQALTYRGAPFSPIFVVEVDTLTGNQFRLGEVDKKMELYFQSGDVRLGWALDPANKIMYTYANRFVGDQPVRSADSSWRDLDGGEILPGQEKTTECCHFKGINF